MNFKKILFVAGLAVASCFSAFAQEGETEYVFNPHWYIQGQFGAQHTLGEIDWTDLNSPNAQVTVGYNWTSVWGARLALNMWQSKGGLKADGKQYAYKWNYVAPTVDVTMNLTNVLWGFNPERVVDVTLFAGLGANIGMNNDEVQDVDKATSYKGETYFDYLWSGSKARLVGQWGADIDFKLNDRVSLGVELACNTLSDRYNSKKANNTDWYFNALAGVKVNLGKTYTKRVKPLPPCEPVYIDRPVEKIVEKIVEVLPPAEGPMRRELFFVIRGSEVNQTERAKLEEVVAYLYRNPEAKVTVTGYADKGTGNPRINQKYSEARAKKVVKLLQESYGIPASRISSSAKGDTEQPFAENDKNRVTILIAE